uniref:Ig-like domain-containing protein n=1 Tax=Plectus sambesii TaxID=2011161 RepID=A0A914VPH7_9BILA
MEEFLFPTFELRLDAADQSQKTEVVQVGAGEAFKVQCIVIGEHHENHDLSWSKDGNELVPNDTLIVADSPPGSSLSKTIVVAGFNTDSHVGSYECSVKRKDNTYQSRKMRLQKKLGNPQIADGFVACPKEKAEACLNGGICMMHKASESVSCLCLSANVGRHCEYFNFEYAWSPSPPDYKPCIVAMSTVIAALLMLMCLCCCCFYSIKQRRQIKRFKIQIEKLRSFTLPERESSPLINMNNPLDDEVSAKLQSMDVQNDHHCYNVGSAQPSPVRSAVPAENAEEQTTLFNDFSRPTIPVIFGTTNEHISSCEKRRLNSV